MTSMPQTCTAAFVKTCNDLADAATRVILPHFRQPILVENKATGAAFDPVTVADKAAERELRDQLAIAWPEHGVIGEEFPNTLPDARYQWVLDPIDGTRSFIMGLPTWGTLIGLTDNGSPTVGMMVQPFTGERFWADEQSAFASQQGLLDRKSTALNTRACPRLDDAIVTTTHPELFTTDAERTSFDRVAQSARMTRYGGDCYQYCMLASGFVDVVIEAGLAPYDIVALIPIVERAGGRITTWAGEPATKGGQILATGDATLHDTVLEMLR